MVRKLQFFLVFKVLVHIVLGLVLCVTWVILKINLNLRGLSFSQDMLGDADGKREPKLPHGGAK